MPGDLLIDMASKAKHLSGGGRCGLAISTFILLCATACPASAGPAAEWRFCYAGHEQGRRFYISQPFLTTGSLESIERQWVTWLGRQAVRSETTGCPRGPDRPGVEAFIKSAVRYNAGLGRNAVELDWQPAP